MESQGQLIGLIEAAKLGLADCRKEMGSINLDSEDAWDAVSHMCDKSKPFVQSYKKHTRTAQSLCLAGNAFLLHALRTAFSCMSTYACVFLRISAAKREANPPKKKVKTETKNDEDDC